MARVETIPLNCPTCGEVHSNTALEASGGACPKPFCDLCNQHLQFGSCENTACAAWASGAVAAQIEDLDDDVAVLVLREQLAIIEARIEGGR